MALAESIVGLWLFTSLFYQGQEIAPPNPALKIQYEFTDTGINTLRYHRDGEQGFCERRAVYEFSQDSLTQQVVWVNPANAPWCGQDVDMQLGRQSRTKAWLKEGRFYLEMSLGEDSIAYIWSRQ